MSVSRELVQGRNPCYVCVVLGDRIANSLKDHQPEIGEDVLPKGPNGGTERVYSQCGVFFVPICHKALAQSWTTLSLICSRRYLMEVDIYYDGLFKTRQGIGLVIRLRRMADYNVPEYGNGYISNGHFLYKIPSPLPHQLYKPVVRLLAKDAHLMPTVPTESALAKSIPSEHTEEGQSWLR